MCPIDCQLIASGGSGDETDLPLSPPISTRSLTLSPTISIPISPDLPLSPSPPIRRCKLCDFGTALEITEGAPLPTACIGSALYLAPEVESEQPYGLPADVFSFGVRAPLIASRE